MTTSRFASTTSRQMAGRSFRLGIFRLYSSAAAGWSPPARDDPLYQITDRDNPEYLVVFHNRKMTYAIVGHNRHALVHRLLLSNENHRARHDLPDLGLLRGSSHEDDLARIVPLRDDARQFALGDDQQRPNPRLGHPFDGLVDRLFRGHRPDITALAFQNRADPVAESQHWRGTS